MVTFKVQWDNGKKIIPVENVDQLDAALDRVAQERGPKGRVFVVDITNGEDFDAIPIGLHMTVGHPVRNKVIWIGPGDGIGCEPDVEPWHGEEIVFDYGHLPTEEPPEYLRVSPEKAREAAREFIRTNMRPTCLLWDKP
ncbi:Imm1 family immunity protein [Actinoplanes sp. NPDC051346]|uniref:Imm1 family immunity protein n=1 Tax=Actinoplanes sp. NPDC051346 TaxID=3155048 RepID=UPI003437D8A1